MTSIESVNIDDCRLKLIRTACTLLTCLLCIILIFSTAASSVSASSLPALDHLKTIEIKVPPDKWGEFISGDPSEAGSISAAIDGVKGTLVYHGNPHSLRKYVKRSLRISSSETAGGRDVRHAVIFKADVSERSLMREWLGLRMFSMAGITSPAVEHVLLKVNGKMQGIYLMIEPVDQYFVSKAFPEDFDRAMLYYGDTFRAKRDTVKPDLSRINSPGQLRAYSPVMISGDEENSGLKEMLLQINAEPLEIKKASSVLDINEWAAWMAVSEIMENKDSPWNTGMRNFSLFFPPDGKWQILPWDTDRIYRGLDCYFPLPDLSGTGNLSRNRNFKAKVKGNIDKLISGTLSAESLLQLISKEVELLQPVIAEGVDPVLNITEWKEALKVLKDNIEKRHAKLKALLVSNPELEPMCSRKRRGRVNAVESRPAR